MLFRLRIVQKIGTMVTCHHVTDGCLIQCHRRQLEAAISTESALDRRKWFTFAGSEDTFVLRQYVLGDHFFQLSAFRCLDFDLFNDLCF